MSSTKRHTYRPGDAIDPGATYYPMDGARQRDPLEPDDVIAALDAMAQEIENLRAELDGRAPVGPAEHWSPWLEWRGGPCPLPPDVPVDTRSRRDIEEYVYRAGKIYWGHDRPDESCRPHVIRFRYHADNPAGWLPRGEFIPPAELWAPECPVRCEWINAAVDSSAVQREQMTPSTWPLATHIRLIARQPQAELPEFVQIDAAADYAIKVGSGHVLTLSADTPPDDIESIGDTFHILAARERARRAGS